MSGEEIRFTGAKGKEVKFELDGNTKNKLDKNEKKLYKALFDAIENYDGKKGISAEEFKMLKDLKTIFAKTGANTDADGTGYILDSGDKAIAEEFAKSQGKDVKTFIAEKLAQINAKKTTPETKTETAPAGETPQAEAKTPAPETQTEKPQTPVAQQSPQTEAPKVEQQPKKQTVSAESQAYSFNRAMQNSAKRFTAEQLGFTQEVEIKSGMALYNIAKDALKGEGVESPTARQVNERIAQIVAMNPQIKDVNNIRVGTKIKVGKGANALAQGNAPVQGEQAGATAFGSGTGTVPVEKPTSGIVVTSDPNPTSEEFTLSNNAPTPEGVDLAGGTLQTYTKGTGEATETKYVYEKDGVKFEAGNVNDLKTKIESFKNAVAEFTKTVPNETSDAKQTRIQGAIDSITALGTESAIKFAQTKLVEQKANVTEDYYAQKTIAMLKSGNPALITQMLGEDGSKFTALVNNNPAVQETVGELVKYLKNKFDNDEYLTLDEQKVLEVLNETVNKDGVSIAAKPAVAEVKEGDVVKTPAQPEVFAKTMVTDSDGNSYYKAKLGGDGALKDVEFKAKDAGVLDAFLAELKVADTDAKKTELFKKYAENTTDSEFLKSLAQNADKLKASATDVIALVNKSNLDVVYSMNIDGFSDTEAADGQPAVTDKTDVQNAIKARIEAIMADAELRKLPENAKYLDKIKELTIPAESTNLEKLPDLTGYTTTTETVTEGENTITVTKYSKDGEADVYQVEFTNPIIGENANISASSKEAVLQLKKDLEALALKRPAEGEDLTAEEKRANLEKLIKIAELCPTVEMYASVIDGLKDNSLIDKNDPDAKALVQKLLLTRNADVLKILIHKNGEGIDYTLFDNDLVALKTMAAMYKEIRAKENAGEKLTPDEIALKEQFQACRGISSCNLDADAICFNDTGLYSGCDGVNNVQPGVDYTTALNEAGDDVAKKQAVINKFINDPRTKEDEQFRYYLATFEVVNASPADQKAIVEMSDARSLAIINLSKISGTDDEKKAVKDAYIQKAKELFTYESADGTKLDPANAQYLNDILANIDSMNYPVAKDGEITDADDAVISEILNNFFVTEGEGENQTTKIKDFRRFTYEEMDGLAQAVASYGTDAQKAALADMITIDDMESGQFVRAIESVKLDSEVRTKYENLFDGITTKEEVLAFIGKMRSPSYHIPFDKVMEKFGNESEVLDTLLKYTASQKRSNGNEISEANRIKLISHVMQTDDKGNVTFDKTKLPEGVTVQNVIDALPCDCKQGESSKMAKAIFMTLDLSDTNVVLLMNNHSMSYDSDMIAKLKKFASSDEVKLGSALGNDFARACAYRVYSEKTQDLFETLYSNAHKGARSLLIRDGRVSDDHVLVGSGDSVDKIVKNYLKNHLDKFPRLKESVDSDTKKWTPARIDEALNDYMQEFRDAIMSDLGITDPTKLQEDDIIELGKIKWNNHQPSWWNYNFYY